MPATRGTTAPPPTPLTTGCPQCGGHISILPPGAIACDRCEWATEYLPLVTAMIDARRKP